MPQLTSHSRFELIWSSFGANQDLEWSFRIIIESMTSILIKLSANIHCVKRVCLWDELMPQLTSHSRFKLIWSNFESNLDPEWDHIVFGWKTSSILNAKVCVCVFAITNAAGDIWGWICPHINCLLLQMSQKRSVNKCSQFKPGEMMGNFCYKVLCLVLLELLTKQCLKEARKN